MALESKLLEVIIGAVIEQGIKNIGGSVRKEGKIGEVSFGSGYSNVEILLHSGLPSNENIKEYLVQPIAPYGYRFNLNMQTTGIWRKKIDTGMVIYIIGYLQGPLCYGCGRLLDYRKKEIEVGMWIFKEKKYVVECSECNHRHDYIESIDVFTKQVSKDMKKLMKNSLGI